MTGSGHFLSVNDSFVAAREDCSETYVLKEFVIIYVERIIQVLVGFVITYLIVNYFNANDYGVYKYVLSLSAMFVLLVLLGFNATNVRYIPAFLLHNDYAKINYQVLLFTVIQFVLVVATLSVLYYLINSELIDISDGIATSYLFLFFVFNYLKAYFGESLLVAFSKRLLLTYIRIFLYFVQLSLICFAVVEESNIQEFVFYLMIISGVEFFLLGLGALSVYVKQLPDATVEKFDLKNQFSYSFNNYGFSWVNFLRDNAATVIVVSYLYSYTEVAYYSVALIIPNIVRSFSPSKVFSGLVMPEFVKRYSLSGDEAVVFDGLGFLSKINLLFLVPAILYSCFLYTFIVESFFGLDYAVNSFSLSLFLFINILFLSYLDINLLAANIFERSNLVLNINLLSVSNILLLFLLSDVGRESIGFSNLASTFLTVIGFWFVFGRIYKRKINFNFFEKNVLVFFGGLLAISAVLYSVSLYLYMFLFPVVALFGVFFMTRTSFFQEFERDFIRGRFALYARVEGLL